MVVAHKARRSLYIKAITDLRGEVVLLKHKLGERVAASLVCVGDLVLTGGQKLTASPIGIPCLTVLLDSSGPHEPTT